MWRFNPRGPLVSESQLISERCFDGTIIFAFEVNRLELIDAPDTQALGSSPCAKWIEKHCCRRDGSGSGWRPERGWFIWRGEWNTITTKDLGWRLHRDASMISRLYGWYQKHRSLE